MAFCCLSLPPALLPEADLLLLEPDFLAVADDEAAPIGLADLLPDDLLLPPADFEPPADLFSAPLLPPSFTAPLPTLISELASDWLETPEPDERLLSLLLPLIRLEEALVVAPALAELSLIAPLAMLLPAPAAPVFCEALGVEFFASFWF